MPLIAPTGGNWHHGHARWMEIGDLGLILVAGGELDCS